MKIGVIECHEYDTIYEEFLFYSRNNKERLTFYMFLMSVLERCKYGLIQEYLAIRPELHRFILKRDGKGNETILGNDDTRAVE